VYIADSYSRRVRVVSPAGLIATVLPAVGETSFPTNVAADHDGNIYIADTFNLRVQKISNDGAVTTMPVNETVDAQAATLFDTRAIAVDSENNLYVAGRQMTRTTSQGYVSIDGGSQTVRKITPDGIRTIAISGPTSEQQIALPWGLAVDAAGNV